MKSHYHHGSLVILVLLALLTGPLWAEQATAADETALAVLPFKNQSTDSAHETLDTILTEDTTNTLGRIPQLLVIAGKGHVDPNDKAAIKQTAQALEAQYILTGSLDASDDQLTVSAELIDADNEQSLWSKDYDTGAADIFEVKDDMTRQVVGALNIELSADDQARVWRRATDNVEAYRRYIHARELLRRFNKEDNLEAQKLSQEILAMDPDFVLAHVNLGWTHIMDAALFEGDLDQSMVRAREQAEKAVAIDPTHVDALLLLGRVHRDPSNPEKEREIQAKAYESNPNNPNAAIFVGGGKAFGGEPEEGLTLIERAIRLNPAHPAWYLWTKAWAQYLSGDYENAAATFEENLSRNSKDAEAWGDLAHTYVKLDRLDDAKSAIDKMLELDDTYTVSRYGKQISTRVKDLSVVEVIQEDLRKAGLKE